MVTLTTLDVNVLIMDFPCPGNEMVVPNEDGSYTILINARLSYDGQLKAYEHAMKHIHESDFEKDSAQAIEAQAHGITIPKNTERVPSVDFEKRLKALRKERAAIQRRMRAYEEKIAFLRAYHPEHFYNSLERQYLYGDDL